MSPCFDDILIWNGVIFPEIGYYKGGIFRFDIMFENENEKFPKIFFKTEIFHPLIDPITNELNLKAEFNKNINNNNNNDKIYIIDIIKYIKNVLIDDIKYWHNSLFIFNKDCFKLYLDYLTKKQNKNHLFMDKIKKCIKLSIENKDKNINKNRNPFILSYNDNDGHSKIIRENLKTFKSFKEINGLIESVAHKM